MEMNMVFIMMLMILPFKIIFLFKWCRWNSPYVYVKNNGKKNVEYINRRVDDNYVLHNYKDRIKIYWESRLVLLKMAFYQRHNPITNSGRGVLQIICIIVGNNWIEEGTCNRYILDKHEFSGGGYHSVLFNINSVTIKIP